jgi:hypothetical protein
MARVFLIIFGSLIVVNLAFLDFQFWLSTRSVQLFPTSEPTVRPVLITPTAVLSSVSPMPTIIISATLTPKPEKILSPRVEPREYFIPFGSGSSQAGDWEDLIGVEAYLDKSKYGRIKEAVFEISGLIPTGNEQAFVRLYNVSDQRPVWNSEVWWEGGGSKFLISSPVNLDQGKKLYRVQMKTSLKYPANLIQARLKITTE